MAPHTHSVARSIRTSDHTTDAAARGAFRIVKTTPETGGALQYHIKAKVDGRRRAVCEDPLDR